MPIYQYKCSECDHRLEALQKMSDPRLTDCPECQKPNLVKQITAAAFKLKGSGWYETDFKNSGAKPTAAKPTESDGSAGSSEGSAEKSANDSPQGTDASQSKSTNDSAKPVSTAVEG